MRITIFKTRTRFMKKIVSKYISKVISEELGCNADIWFNDVDISMYRGRIHTHIEMWAGVDRKGLINAVKSSKD